MAKLLSVFLIAIVLFSSCSVQLKQPNSNSSNPGTEKSVPNSNTPNVNKFMANSIENSEVKKVDKSENTNCLSLKRDDLFLDKKQTFSIDFKPFEGGCFVTFHDPEFDNPPLGSQFYIYKDGKEVFEFPEQFGGGNTTCWVDAVAFEDVNNDQMKDVIIIGKCGGKSSDYNENMIYLNNGRDFSTNSESNAELMDFSKVSQIREFVKKNPKMFVP